MYFTFLIFTPNVSCNSKNGPPLILFFGQLCEIPYFISIYPLRLKFFSKFLNHFIKKWP